MQRVELSRTVPDARLLSKGDQTLAGYNVQAAVDDKHKLIVASEVVNASMAKAASEVLEAQTLQVLADAGYYSSAELKACEDDGIVAYVPPSEGNGRIEKEGRFSLKDFGYDGTADAYRCPAGEAAGEAQKAICRRTWPISAWAGRPVTLWAVGLAQARM
jgi:hypothetical protein